jgi:hypothetical protein
MLSVNVRGPCRERHFFGHKLADLLEGALESEKKARGVGARVLWVRVVLGGGGSEFLDWDLLAGAGGTGAFRWVAHSSPILA